MRWIPARMAFREPERSALLFAALLAMPAAASADEIAFDLRETAGIRRFGYPAFVELKLDPPAPPSTRFRLLEKGKPVPAQFRAVSHEGERMAAVALDFEVSCLPRESRRFTIELGEDGAAGLEPDRGLRLEEAGDVFRIANGASLEWVVPRSLAGLLSSVKTPATDYLQPDSEGLSIRFRDGGRSRIGGSGSTDWRTKASVVKAGPIACRIRFESIEPLPGRLEVSSAVTLDIPRSKSWVRVRWTVDDPGDVVFGLDAQLGLKLDGEPILIDFGAGTLVYAALPRGHAAALRAGSTGPPLPGRAPTPRWETWRGPAGKLEPYVFGAEDAGAPPAEGWVHVMDSERCTAAAVGGFGAGARDQMEVDAGGRLEMRRDFAADGAKPGAAPKSLELWLHFVSMPPHVGAVTSPQSMMSPLEVVWVPR